MNTTRPTRWQTAWPTRRRALWLILLCVGLLMGLGAGLVGWLNVRGEAPVLPGVDPGPVDQGLDQAQVARGAYLARAGNCMGCHTAGGGAPYAGGRDIATPFGSVVAPNITPDAATGIGAWSASEFWRALHHGRSKDGRLLYPAFPYPSYTHIHREDSDALYAYLRSLPPVHHPNQPHRLSFPYNTQAALALWRALYFRPAAFEAQFEPQAGQSVAWNRGKYLVQGLGHCAACHSTRNALGGSPLQAEFAGGLMPDGGWYAPSLASAAESGLQGWPLDEAVRLLKTGVSTGASTQASVSGPMAEVVYNSTQHLTQDDVQAMVLYLASIPQKQPRPVQVKLAEPGLMAQGGRLYGQHCAACHGEQGQGVSGIYPALAGNRAVNLPNPNNLVQLIRHGGFAPSTQGNPRPFGMPPFGQALSNDDIAAVASYIRQSWGNQAAPVSALEVLRVR